ncbi:MULTISPECIES: hypothetical protein [Curtobacterium]|jgi:hypothetical protein|uniref:Uncharacterized protein n=2 Tax=Curtobacterium TaxID=2034 RepID=A0A9Q2W614_9MICO|nr:MULTISPECIES: hypothetical protein [Curtobacterium]EYT63547.1 hypothetical protein H489_0110960 [Curtobacterium flaccumfaciens UCD-AKU]KIQ10058.1 hypothetical protein RU06_07030 [Curtobacterium flaccumfaciens]KQR29866.1 hypothetical protein ASF75_11305 [Curtobacterium sp. Leaf154]MBF4595856.1 hypothetical protein [Curtobacterium sp. VKM Ac-1796]MBF4610972.1 hypothetical protein [Curtobacterium sp. VKM Ac-2889]
MGNSFTLPDAASLGDLRTYLGRAARIEDGSVRLIADSGVLAVYTAILYPLGLLDELPTVLGLRTFSLTEPASIDTVVPLQSLLERLRLLAETQDAEHAEGADPTRATPIEVELPHEVHTVTWAAISPPRGGWVPLPDVSPELLRRATRDGIAEVADAVPSNSGEAIVRRIRAEVWGRPVPGVEHLPAGAGFAGESLGFLGHDPVRLFETGPWSRLTTSRGHVLVKRRAWTLSS